MDRPTKIVVMGDDPERVAEDYLDKTVILIYNKKMKPSAAVLTRKNVKPVFMPFETYPDIDCLSQIRDVIYYLLNSSYIKIDDKVLFVFSKKGEYHQLYFDMSMLKNVRLIESVSDRIKKEVMEKILQLAMMIVHRGKEGQPAGALLIVGDTKNVMKYAIQKIYNPARAMDRFERSVLNDENLDSIREYAMMDGATIINERGEVISFGVYIKNLEIQDKDLIEEWLTGNYGGRHLAAKAITKKTKAICVLVSSEGIIRIFRDGKKIHEFGIL